MCLRKIPGLDLRWTKCERAFIFITVFFFGGGGGGAGRGAEIKKTLIFTTVLRGGKNLNIFMTVVLGEKMKKILFSLPFFWERI